MIGDRTKIRSGPPPAWLVEHTGRNLHEVGPSPATMAEWSAAGLTLPDLAAMRRYRVARIREQLAAHDCDGALLYDPLNIRYATDSTNMSVWTMHNAVRFAFVATDGPLVMFEYSNGEFLSLHNDVVDEIRPARSLHPFYVGDRVDEIAAVWADEIVELIDGSARSGGRRLAIDVLGLDAIRALEARGVELVSGQRLMENARVVKSSDEILAMRLACFSCDRVIAEMRAALRPGMTEVELWSMLHVGNWERFGEWVETRLLSSGPRTNPWYQEASAKLIEDGELVAFDTDLVGAYGMCVDVSRTWLCGGGTPSADQRDLFARAVDSIESNIPLFVPGATYREITERLRYPPVDEFNGYTVLAHGVGLCDEYPSLYTREQWEVAGFEGVVEAGNVISVESFVGRRSGGEGVKLEQQILVTESGPELLSLDPLSL
ncbi:MAG: Xaa-Pro peptidase family protein [Ilumatobacter sp.]|uniref:M24 family metallopeptidase n=1 Tax=Ilumatobacter sp. TaxID=1967498 RepID=UPI00261CCC42|nr:Xaa-Pro peptidase family protein [Ilumatobacter sp.]MDJ0768286.1 Xaa-Pro peptidase family protein [Ilumatobacter sp.]